MCPMPAAVAPLPTASHSSTPTDAPAEASSSAHAAPTMPAPTMSTSKESRTADAPTKWITLVEEQAAFESDEGRPCDARPDARTLTRVRGLETAADNALLHPYLSGRERAVHGQAGDLRAGSRAAGRPVVRLAGAEHEIAVVRAIRAGSAELDVVDERAALPGHPLILQRLPDAPGEVRELLDARRAQLLPVVVHEEKPVSAPGDVAC